MSEETSRVILDHHIRLSVQSSVTSMYIWYCLYKNEVLLIMMMLMYLLVKTKKLCTFTLLAVTAPFNNCAV